MKNFTLAMTWLLAALAGVHGQTNGRPVMRNAKAEQEVRAVRQELVEAGRRKDRAAYERLIAEGFTFVHSTGGIESKSEYIDHAVSGAQLFQRADSETRAERINVYDGRTAVWTSHSVWRNRNDNRESILRSLNVFVKSAGRWQWAAGQSTRLPSRPRAAAIDRNIYQQFIGLYEVVAGRTLTVTQESETLRGLMTGIRPAELIPQSVTEFVWFNPDYNIYSQILFIKDESGRVTHAAFRRDGQEVWRARKVK